MIGPQTGEIWRIHHWKNPDDHNKGIKVWHYLLLDLYCDNDKNLGTYYLAMELETGQCNAYIPLTMFKKVTRDCCDTMAHDYIVFAERLA